MIGWENSSELWDPSVSCNEFINPSNNDLNELLKEKKIILWHDMFNAVRHWHCIIKNSSHMQHFVMELLCLIEAVNKSCHSSSQECISGLTVSLLECLLLEAFRNASLVELESGIQTCREMLMRGMKGKSCHKSVLCGLTSFFHLCPFFSYVVEMYLKAIVVIEICSTDPIHYINKIHLQLHITILYAVGIPEIVIIRKHVG